MLTKNKRNSLFMDFLIAKRKIVPVNEQKIVSRRYHNAGVSGNEINISDFAILNKFCNFAQI